MGWKSRPFRLLGVVALLAALPASASAQAPAVPDLVGPLQPPGAPTPAPAPAPTPAPTPPSSPTTGGVAFETTPEGTRAVDRQVVSGALDRLWSVRLPGQVSRPLAAGGLVLVTSGGTIVALDARTGKQVWKAAGRAGAQLAVDGDTVLTVERGALARGLSLADGRVRWTRQLPPLDGNRPQFASTVARGGRMFVRTISSSSVQSGIYAVSVADGSILWSRVVAIGSVTRVTLPPMPTLDGERVYLGDSCGDVEALSQATGARAWRAAPVVGCSTGAVAPVSGGRVYVTTGGGVLGGREAAKVYDAASGALVATLPVQGPEALAGGLGFAGASRLLAFDLATGKQKWSRRVSRQGPGLLPGSPSPPPPLVVGGGTTVFTAIGSTVTGVDVSTGRISAVSRLPDSSGDLGGLAATGDALVVGHGTRVTALRSYFSPDPGEVEIETSGRDYDSGGGFTLFAAAGRDLAKPGTRFVVEADPYPYGRWERAAASTGFADGTTYYSCYVYRNTRWRVRIAGTKVVSKAITLYAYPRVKAKTPLVSRTARDAVVTLSGDPGFKLLGRRAYAYLGRNGKKRWERLGAGVLRKAGKGRAVFRARYRVPRPWGRKDGVWWCIPGDRTYGRMDKLTRRCGAALIEY